MNRYAAAGIAADAAAGKNVLVLCRSSAEERAAFGWVADRVVPEEVRRSVCGTGIRKVELVSGGVVRFCTLGDTRLIGASPDVVYLDTPHVVHSTLSSYAQFCILAARPDCEVIGL